MSVLIKPYLTEKTHAQSVFNRFAFVVEPKASKHQVREEVERLFKVNVLKVTTITKKAVYGRSNRTGKEVTQKRLSKIALVQLKDKQTIDLFKTK